MSNAKCGRWTDLNSALSRNGPPAREVRLVQLSGASSPLPLRERGRGRGLLLETAVPVRPLSPTPLPRGERGCSTRARRLPCAARVSADDYQFTPLPLRERGRGSGVAVVNIYPAESNSLPL